MSPRARSTGGVGVVAGGRALAGTAVASHTDPQRSGGAAPASTALPDNTAVPSVEAVGSNPDYVSVLEARFLAHGRGFTVSDSHGRVLVWSIGHQEPYALAAAQQYLEADNNELIRDHEFNVADASTQLPPHLTLSAQRLMTMAGFLLPFQPPRMQPSAFPTPPPPGALLDRVLAAERIRADVEELKSIRTPRPQRGRKARHRPALVTYAEVGRPMPSVLDLRADASEYGAAVAATASSRAVARMVEQLHNPEPPEPIQATDANADGNARLPRTSRPQRTSRRVVTLDDDDSGSDRRGGGRGRGQGRRRGRGRGRRLTGDGDIDLDDDDDDDDDDEAEFAPDREAGSDAVLTRFTEEAVRRQQEDRARRLARRRQQQRRPGAAGGGRAGGDHLVSSEDGFSPDASGSDSEDPDAWLLSGSGSDGHRRARTTRARRGQRKQRSRAARNTGRRVVDQSSGSEEGGDDGVGGFSAIAPAKSRSKATSHRVQCDRSWLLNETPPVRTYVPQAGDRVVYFHQGHAMVLLHRPTGVEFPLYKFPSADWTAVLCVVESVGYSFPTASAVGPICVDCCLRAVGVADGTQGDGLFRDLTAAETPEPFSVSFSPEDPVDFLIPVHRYEEALGYGWEENSPFRALFNEGDGVQTYYRGTIVAFSPLEAQLSHSPWEAVQVRWDGSDDASRVSMWDLDPLPRTRHRDESDQQPLFKPVLPLPAPQAAALDMLRSFETWVRTDTSDVHGAYDLRLLEMFMVDIDKGFAADQRAVLYWAAVPLPMNLAMVMKRLQVGYYRSAQAVMDDVSLVRDNLVTYWGTDTYVRRVSRRTGTERLLTLCLCYDWEQDDACVREPVREGCENGCGG